MNLEGPSPAAELVAVSSFKDTLRIPYRLTGSLRTGTAQAGAGERGRPVQCGDRSRAVS